ncbi:MAG: hypothetical protein LBI62_04735 [Candidatus Accumulibacter sp.]|nr:hypothetical protein [Accumulibacter sp.]
MTCKAPFRPDGRSAGVRYQGSGIRYQKKLPPAKAGAEMLGRGVFRIFRIA